VRFKPIQLSTVEYSDTLLDLISIHINKKGGRPPET